MRITINNIAKIHEDVLYKKLDELFEKGLSDSQEYKFIEQETDRRDEIYIRNRKAKEAEERRVLEERARLMEEYHKLEQTVPGRLRMKAMVEVFGDDFIQNYYIDSEYTVTSLAQGNEHFGNNCTWEHETNADANGKVFMLVYWRVYDKYFRDGPTQESLDKLHGKIISLKEIKC